MGIFDLFRSETLSGKRIRNSYKISGSPIEYCKKIINMPGFNQSKIRLNIEGEEMQPNRKVLISSLGDLIRLSKEENISSCTFKGTYNGKPADIVVDYGLKMINVVSEDSKIIETITRNLEG